MHTGDGSTKSDIEPAGSPHTGQRWTLPPTPLFVAEEGKNPEAPCRPAGAVLGDVGDGVPEGSPKHGHPHPQTTQASGRFGPCLLGWPSSGPAALTLRA